MGWCNQFGFYLCLFLTTSVFAQNPSSNVVRDPVIQGFPIRVSPKNCPCDHPCGPPITIQNRFNISLETNSSDFWGSLAESIYFTLPDIIHMYRPDFGNKTIANLANKGTPVLVDAVIDAMRHKTNVTAADINSTTCQNNRTLHRRELLETRDIIGDIVGALGDLVQDIGNDAHDFFCGSFALGADPGFSAAAGTFHAINGDGIPMTDAQLFFVHAALGSGIPSGIVVNYDASFPFVFSDDTVGITFDTNIYTRKGAYTMSDYNQDNIFAIDQNFADTVAIVVHETQHVFQYASFGWNIWNFGYQYLYQFCEAGFKYSANTYEVQAFTTQYSIYPLLNEPYSAFYNIWGAYNLKNQLGFPTTVNVDTSSWNGEPNEALAFDYGLLEIRYNSKCFRVWSGHDWAVLSASYCTIGNPPSFPHTKPCPPECGKPPDLNAIKKHNQACKAAKLKANALILVKPWSCPQGR